jgi:hypothetical protein
MHDLPDLLDAALGIIHVADPNASPNAAVIHSHNIAILQALYAAHKREGRVPSTVDDRVLQNRKY